MEDFNVNSTKKGDSNLGKNKNEHKNVSKIFSVIILIICVTIVAIIVLHKTTDKRKISTENLYSTINEISSVKIDGTCQLDQVTISNFEVKKENANKTTITAMITNNGEKDFEGKNATIVIDEKSGEKIELLAFINATKAGETNQMEIITNKNIDYNISKISIEEEN